MRLRLSQKAAEQLVSVSQEEKDAAKVARVKQREQDEVERQEKKADQQAHRDKIKHDRQEAADADTRLTAALDNLDAIRDSLEAGSRDRAERNVSTRVYELKVKQQDVLRLEEELADARARVTHAQSNLARDRTTLLEMKDRAEIGVAEAQVEVHDAWDHSQRVWASMSTGYRKKHRDRKAKNRAKAVLGN